MGKLQNAFENFVQGLINHFIFEAILFILASSGVVVMWSWLIENLTPEVRFVIGFIMTALAVFMMWLLIKVKKKEVEFKRGNLARAAFELAKTVKQYENDEDLCKIVMGIDEKTEMPRAIQRLHDGKRYEIRKLWTEEKKPDEKQETNNEKQ